jgi:hypothetical protein
VTGGCCSEGLVTAKRVTWSRTADAGHLLEGAGLCQGRTLVGSHRCTPFQDARPPFLPFLTPSHRRLRPPTRRPTEQTWTALGLPESGKALVKVNHKLRTAPRFILNSTSDNSKPKVGYDNNDRRIDLDQIQGRGYVASSPLTQEPVPPARRQADPFGLGRSCPRPSWRSLCKTSVTAKLTANRHDTRDPQG